MDDRPPDVSTETTPEPGSGADRDERRESPFSRRSFSWTLVVKIVLLGAVNALAIWSLPVILGQRWWPGLIVIGVSTLLLDYAYLSKRAIPLKYLIPGTIFTVAFQVIPVVYSGYIAFTNFSTANRLSEEQAIEQITSRTSNVPGSIRYQLVILGADGGDGEIAFLLTEDGGDRFLGTSEGIEPVDPSEVETDDSDRVAAVDGYTALTIRQIGDRQQEILGEFEVPTDDGVIRAATVSSAAVYLPLYAYDESSGLLTDTATGVVYQPLDGRFTADDGATLEPGWVVVIGFDNFTKILTSEAIRGPFVRVFVWNYGFAFLSVVTTFVVGLALAMALNHPTMHGRKVYRSLLIIPYALPSFMTALIWRGMLNTEFGVINEVLGVQVEWLRDPTLAKLSVLIVNLWLGFPYMFLISTGALQAIPEEMKEAAYVDGASPRQAFRRVTLPMLMVSLAPLLIASFAFNFNNFNIIYLLNRGGPPIAGAETPAGHTDILISYTYRLAFESGRGADWGLASAIAMLIFLMIATLSAISFRRTRALEDLT
jgi:arabinogalactan oligomer/maltooligosaccharide transport system permease protein